MLFERPGGGEQAVLVHIDFADGGQREDPDEFRDLAASAGAEVAAFVNGQRKTPQPRLYIGSGKLEEVLTADALSSTFGMPLEIERRGQRWRSWAPGVDEGVTQTGGTR